MRAIAQALKALFSLTKGVGVRTGRGLLQHGAGKYAVRAVRSMEIQVGGRVLTYEALNEFDKAVVDETVEYSVRVASEYIDHHDEYSNYRIKANSLDEVVLSHAQEITNAATQALYSRLRSHAYDVVVGKPKRVAIFQDEDMVKQLVQAVIQEVVEHLEVHHRQA